MIWEEDLEILQYLCETNLDCYSDESFYTAISTDEASPRKVLNREFAEVLLLALNCDYAPEMKEILSHICDPNMSVTHNCYAKALSCDMHASNQETFSSLPPIYGLDSFVDYWMKVHETTPDCVMTLKTPVRLCHRTKKGECAYIFGVELVGTMLAWIDTPYPLTFQSNHFQPLSQQHMCLMGRRAVTASIEKRGSVIMYVNERKQVIDRLDFYLEI
eukprot:gene15173-16941_t